MLSNHNRMSLASACVDLHQIASLLVAEHELITAMRADGVGPEPEAEARCYGAAMAQLALMIRPMQMAALDAEMASVWVA